MIAGRVLDPRSKLAAARGLNSGTQADTLGEETGAEDATADLLTQELDADHPSVSRSGESRGAFGASPLCASGQCSPSSSREQKRFPKYLVSTIAGGAKHEEQDTYVPSLPPSLEGARLLVGWTPFTGNIYVYKWWKRTNVSNIVWCIENQIDASVHEDVFPYIRTPVDVKHKAKEYEPEDRDLLDIRTVWLKNLKSY